jgi:hypothetical protein
MKEDDEFRETIERFGRTADILTATWLCRCSCGGKGVWILERGFTCWACGGRGKITAILSRLGGAA